jgi:hypothetical protein
MERVPRLVGLAAWAILVLGAGLYVTGSHLAAQRFMTQVAGTREPEAFRSAAGRSASATRLAPRPAG